MKKFLLISPKNRTVYNFRGDLINEIQNKGYNVYVTGPDKTDIDYISRIGVEFIEIPVNKNGTSIVGDLKYCTRLYKIIRRIKPDATLGYTIKPVVYGAIASKLAGVPNINSLITGGGYTFISKTLKAKILGVIVRTLYRVGLAFSNHVMFQNRDDLEEFCARHLVSRKKTNVVNGSGINCNKFPQQPQPEGITFFMLSRLLKSKGVVEYLEAAKIVKAKFPNVRFMLLGKYEYDMQDAVPKEYVESLERQGIIERFDETHDTLPFYAQCSVYVLPSYREGTPRTVLEAMSCGRAILTTDTNGCRETVQDGVNGFLVSVKDVATLAEKMIEFINNPALIVSMGAKSREYCIAKFEVSKVNKAMLEIMNI